MAVGIKSMILIGGCNAILALFTSAFYNATILNKAHVFLGQINVTFPNQADF